MGLAILRSLGIGIVILLSVVIVITTISIGQGRLYVVKSGSMEPAIHTGSVVYSSKKDAYSVGDVITFRISNSKDTVTHRVIEVKNDLNNAVFYTVKGDANQSPDADPIPSKDVVGSVEYAIPYVGYFVGFVRSLPGLILLVIIPATLIVFTEFNKLTNMVNNPKHKYVKR